jgi:hypothetical protein
LSPGNFDGSTLIYHVCVENHVCLSHGVHVTDVVWWTAMRTMAGIGGMVQRTGDGQSQVGYSVAGRSRGRVILCVVCTMHKEMKSVDFFVWSQN